MMFSDADRDSADCILLIPSVYFSSTKGIVGLSKIEH